MKERKKKRKEKGKERGSKKQCQGNGNSKLKLPLKGLHVELLKIPSS
jgi:hypothetical protein